MNRFETWAMSIVCGIGCVVLIGDAVIGVLQLLSKSMTELIIVSFLIGFGMDVGIRIIRDAKGTHR